MEHCSNKFQIKRCSNRALTEQYTLANHACQAPWPCSWRYSRRKWQNWFCFRLPIFESYFSFRLPLFGIHFSFRSPLFDIHFSFRSPVLKALFFSGYHVLRGGVPPSNFWNFWFNKKIKTSLNYLLCHHNQHPKLHIILKVLIKW